MQQPIEKKYLEHLKIELNKIKTKSSKNTGHNKIK